MTMTANQIETDFPFGLTGPTIAQRHALEDAGYEIVDGRKASDNSYFPAVSSGGYRKEAVAVTGRVFALTRGKPAYHGDVLIVPCPVSEEEEPASWRREPFYGGAQWHHPNFGCVEGRFDLSQFDQDCDHWVAIRPGQSYSEGKGFPTVDQAMDYLREHKRLRDEVEYYLEGTNRLDGLLAKEFMEDIARLEAA